MQVETYYSNEHEKEQKMPELRLEVIAENGTGYGEGGISLNERIGLDRSDPEYVDDIQLSKLDNLIYSQEILVPVDCNADGSLLDDDGCGDGRGVKSISSKINGLVLQKNRSLNRSKIFGGGPAMAGGALIATGDISPELTDDIFNEGINALQHNMIDFGAHTADHVTGDGCGCGAIDNAPSILQNIVKYQNNISENIEALGIPTNGLETVLDNFEIAAAQTLDKPFAGKNVMNNIIDLGKFVKDLTGNHREAAVILNTVNGFTVDQEKVRTLTNETLQVFAVDVWRLKDISERLYPDDEQKQLTALQGMLVYTLSTAATLTKGDLPVYRLNKEALVAA